MRSWNFTSRLAGFLVASLFAGSAWAQDDYYPLETGNLWIFAESSADGQETKLRWEQSLLTFDWGAGLELSILRDDRNRMRVVSKRDNVAAVWQNQRLLWQLEPDQEWTQTLDECRTRSGWSGVGRSFDRIVDENYFYNILENHTSIRDTCRNRDEGRLDVFAPGWGPIYRRTDDRESRIFYANVGGAELPRQASAGVDAPNMQLSMRVVLGTTRAVAGSSVPMALVVRNNSDRVLRSDANTALKLLWRGEDNTELGTPQSLANPKFKIYPGSSWVLTTTLEMAPSDTPQQVQGKGEIIVGLTHQGEQVETSVPLQWLPVDNAFRCGPYVCRKDQEYCEDSVPGAQPPPGAIYESCRPHAPGCGPGATCEVCTGIAADPIIPGGLSSCEGSYESGFVARLVFP